MTAIGYKVVIENNDEPSAFFELRIGDDFRPFHLFVRLGGKEIGVNTMVGGVWGLEAIVARNRSTASMGTIFVRVAGERVMLSIGKIQREFLLQQAPNQEAPHVVTRNMKWETLPAVLLQLPLHLNPADVVVDAWGAGKNIRVDGAAGEFDTVRLQHPRQDLVTKYVQFMASCPVYDDAGQVTIFDVDTDTDILAIQARALLSAARIVKLADGAVDKAAIAKLLKHNNLGKIDFLTLAQIKTEIAATQSAMLLQGANVFAQLGKQIAALDDSVRHKLSIWSCEDDIIPCSKLYPCKNIQLHCPPFWTLNESSAAKVFDRRKGLDVTIAAYNAKEYLITCAESLLCQGRDDIRVIIVDDGSTDGSGEAAAEYFAKDARVRVERKANGGCASARNYGRLVSDATHIAFVDADDFVTPNFFADLYDLAVYTGCEMTQAGFDFYDESREVPYYASYEEEVFKDIPRSSFKGMDLIHLHAADIIKGQPTIWRKVYRRDFLDFKGIYFPENVRAYDDYIFQMLTLTEARDVYMLPQHLYHYRQHPAQDIKQGDERHFNMFFMFRMLLRRAVQEGWGNFRPYGESITDCIGWSSSILRPELVESFLRASAHFCVAVRRSYGLHAMSDDLVEKIQHPDFRVFFDECMRNTAHVPDGVHWAFFDGPTFTPEFIKSRNALVRSY